MTIVPDPFDLDRFVAAQNPVYQQVLSELAAGRKRTHWMWFIFPQLRGLGHSAMAHTYGIASREEALAYLEHPLLGPRLRECVQLVNQIEGHTIHQILGAPDDLKFRSSVTLFAAVASNDSLFQTALDKYFAGQPDPLTTSLLISSIPLEPLS